MALVDVKALIVDVLQEPLDDLAVGAVVKGQAAVPVDDEVVYLVVECRRSAVFCGGTEPVGNGFYQALALCALCVDRDRHVSDLLVFW